MESRIGSASCGFVLGAHHEAAGHGAQGRVVRGHPGAGVDEQVAADGARVRDLALADRGVAHTSPCLAQLVDLVHDAAEVTLPVRMQAGRHGQWDGGGRYGYIWWHIGIGELPGPVCPRRGLLEAVGHGWRPRARSLGDGLRATQTMRVLYARRLSSIRHVAQVMSRSLLCE